MKRRYILMLALIHLLAGCAAPEYVVIEEQRGAHGTTQSYHQIKQTPESRMRQKLDKIKRDDAR